MVMVDFPHWTVNVYPPVAKNPCGYQRDLAEMSTIFPWHVVGRVVELSEFLRNIVALSELVFPQKTKFLLFWV